MMNSKLGFTIGRLTIYDLFTIYGLGYLTQIGH